MYTYRNTATKIISKLVTPLVLIILLSSCSSYEDGPWFSIYSKAERMRGNWLFKKVTVDGEDKTADYENHVLTLTKDGKVDWVMGYYENYESYGHQGNWSFSNNKTRVVMHFNRGVLEEYSLTWTIRRLAYGDLQLYRDEDGKRIEWELNTNW